MSEKITGKPTILDARSLALRIGDRTLIRNLQLDVREGELWCVLGPNGSGKSTLLRTLGGLRGADEGEVWLEDRAVQQWDPRSAARRRAMLLQGQTYAFSASVVDSVLLGRHPHLGRFGWPAAHDRECVQAAMHCMDIAHLAARDVLSLSGGERQRVAVAAVLAQDPKLFLLDEPTTHLDLVHQVALFRHLAAVATGTGRAVVVATHEYNLATRFATHALLLYGDGRTYAGTAANVLRAERLSEVFGFALGQHAGACSRGFLPQW
jgi:iron complex transport system ATP-binding protein